MVEFKAVELETSTKGKMFFSGCLWRTKFLHGKIWEKKGRYGPGFWRLCGITYLRIVILAELFGLTLQIFWKNPLLWEGSNLQKKFRDWYCNEDYLRLLSIFILWNISKTRNRAIFENIPPLVNLCSLKSISLFKEFDEVKKKRLKWKYYRFW